MGEQKRVFTKLVIHVFMELALYMGDSHGGTEKGLHQTGHPCLYGAGFVHGGQSWGDRKGSSPKWSSMSLWSWLCTRGTVMGGQKRVFTKLVIHV
ncbi:unnamed protein product, partial [Staurois parvus]